MSLFKVKSLRVHFPVQHGVFSRAAAWVKAVDDVSFQIELGESGCGKTALGRAIVRLTEPTSGHVLFESEDFARLNGSASRIAGRQKVLESGRRSVRKFSVRKHHINKGNSA